MNPIASRVAAWLGPAVRWWLGELAGMVPGALRRRLDRGAASLLVAIDHRGAAISHTLNGRVAEIGHVALSVLVPAVPRERLARLLREAGLARPLARGDLLVCVRLPSTDGLRHVITLPLAAEENLQEVVSFELERLTPFRAADVYFAARLVRRDAARQRLEVDLTVAPRAVVEEALQALAQLGLTPDLVEVAAADPAEPPSGNLLPAPRQLGERRALRRPAVVLAALATGLATVAVALPLQRAHTTAQALASQLEDAKALAADGVRLQKEIERLRADGQFLINRKRQSATVSEVLNEITRLLPDDTWLMELQVNGADIRIDGESPAASALIGLMEQTPLFRDAAFGSPVMQDAASGREHFQIGARIARDGER